MEDYLKSGRPHTIRTDTNIATVKQLIDGNCSLSNRKKSFQLSVLIMRRFPEFQIINCSNVAMFVSLRGLRDRPVLKLSSRVVR